MDSRLSPFKLWFLGLLLLAYGLFNPGCQCGGPTAEEEPGVERPTIGTEKRSNEPLQEPSRERQTDSQQEPEGPLNEKVEVDGSESLKESLPEKEAEPVDSGAGKEASPPETPTDQPPPGPRFHFRVNSPVEDTVPPKLLKVTYTPSNVKAGEWVTIRIAVGPDLSEVTNAQITISGPKDKHSLYVDTAYHPSLKVFQATVRIPARSEPGTWYAQRLTLQDGARRPSIYTAQQAPLKGSTFVVTSANPDVTAPSLTKIALDSYQVKARETLGFTLEASDSGVGLSGLELEVRPVKGSGRVTSRVLYHPAKKAYVGILRFPSSATPGKWKVTRVDLSDSLGNRAFLSSSDALLKNLTFDVLPNGTPPAKDTTPPEVVSAWLEPSVVKAGEAVRVLVSGKDNLSGIRWARVTFANPKGSIRFQYDLRFNAATGLWEGNGYVPRYSINGLWRLASIQLTDFAGNVRTVEKDDLYQKTPLLSKTRRENRTEHLAFQAVPGAKVDRIPPSIKGINLAPGVVTAGESVRVYARLEDKGGSGVNSASCTFTGPFGRATQRQVLLTPNSDTGFFEGTLTFSLSTPPGAWWISGCFLQDKAGNTAPVAGWALTKLPPLDISRATSKASKDSFVVQVKSSGLSPSSDTKPPVMKALHVAPGKYVSLGVARFFAKVEDTNGSGVAGGTCQFSTPSGLGLGFTQISSLTAFMKFNPATGFWESQFNIPREAVRGNWWIRSCSWRDRAGNVATFSAKAMALMPALSMAHSNIPVPKEHRGFVITPGTNPDTKAPLVLSVNLAPRKVKAGEQTRVYLKASDDEEVVTAFCSLKPSLLERPFTAYGSANLTWNPGNLLWEGNYRLSPQAQSGWWSLAGCQVVDRRGNRWNEGPQVVRKVPKLDIRGILSATLNKKTSIPVTRKTPRDTEPPEGNKIKWLPSTQVNAGNAAVLQLTASDKGLGILRAEAFVRSPSGNQQVYTNLPFNAVTQKWEGLVTFPSNAEKGKWIVSKLDIYDLSGNIKGYKSTDTLLKSTQIQVVGGTPNKDQKAPEVKSLKASKAVVLAGESVRWSAVITDDLSGVAGATIQLRSPKKGLIASGQLRWNPATELWEGETVLPKNGEDGTWVVSTLTVRDKAGRFASFDPTTSLLKGRSITVRNTPPKVDTEAPKISNISILPKAIEVGQSFLIRADVSDNLSGVSQVSVQIESEKKERLFFLQLQWNPATLKYEATLKVGPEAPAGKWEITSISLFDQAGNSRFIQKGSTFLP